MPSVSYLKEKQFQIPIELKYEPFNLMARGTFYIAISLPQYKTRIEKKKRKRGNKILFYTPPVLLVIYRLVFLFYMSQIYILVFR